MRDESVRIRQACGIAYADVQGEPPDAAFSADETGTLFGTLRPCYGGTLRVGLEKNTKDLNGRGDRI